MRPEIKLLHKITDWDDAYDNGNNIPQGQNWPGLWAAAAAKFREDIEGQYTATYDLPYGDDPRQRFDLLEPIGTRKGLVVFIHGGFWHKLDKSAFTHLAKGSLDNGYAVAIPSYRLCPNVRISDIKNDIGRAIQTVAERINGPIRLIGHSAGGQLVAMVVTQTSMTDQKVQSRIANVVSVSGLHDLRPLISIKMNAILNIDAVEASLQSPALLMPVDGARITCWVGGAERSEFLRQNDLLANIWKGLGAETASVQQPDRHHFNILDDLAWKDSHLTRTLLG